MYIGSLSPENYMGLQGAVVTVASEAPDQQFLDELSSLAHVVVRSMTRRSVTVRLMQQEDFMHVHFHLFPEDLPTIRNKYVFRSLRIVLDTMCRKQALHVKLDIQQNVGRAPRVLQTGSVTSLYRSPPRN
jgi:hypothetical protein